MLFCKGNCISCPYSEVQLLLYHFCLSLRTFEAENIFAWLEYKVKCWGCLGSEMKSWLCHFKSAAEHNWYVMCLKLMPFGLAVNSEKTLKKKRKKRHWLLFLLAYILGQTDVEPFAGSTSPPPLYLKLRKTVERKKYSDLLWHK